MDGGKLTGIAWGLFFVVVGISLGLQETYKGLNPWLIIALGLGLILIGLNLARKALGMRFGRFSFLIGVVAVLVGIGPFVNVSIPLLPAVIILIGLFILAETISRR